MVPERRRRRRRIKLSIKRYIKRFIRASRVAVRAGEQQGFGEHGRRRSSFLSGAYCSSLAGLILLGS